MDKAEPTPYAVNILLRNLLQDLIPRLERLNAALSDIAASTEALLENWPAPTVAERQRQALADLESRVKALEGMHPAVVRLNKSHWPASSAGSLPPYLQDERGVPYEPIPAAETTTGAPWPDHVVMG